MQMMNTLKIQVPALAVAIALRLFAGYVGLTDIGFTDNRDRHRPKSV